MKNLFALLSSVLLITGCQTSQIGDVSSDPSISSKEMVFEARGSDAGNIPLKTVFFPYDSSSLTATSQRILRNNAKWVQQTGAVIEVEGHCDTRGSAEYNLALGERRAKVVRKFLIQLGVPSRQITTISYGKEKLLVGGDDDTAHGRNRRANFVPVEK